MKISNIIKQEVSDYINNSVEVSEGIPYSEYKLKKRIALFKNKHYPTGKVTRSGEYEHWFDIISPRIDNVVKNLRIDSKNVMLFSRSPVEDFAAVYIGNAALQEEMRDSDKAEELKEVVEAYVSDGNMLFRRTTDGFEPWDPENTFITNTTAKTIEDTAIIERFYMTQSELRSSGYKDVDKVIEKCGGKRFKKTEKTKEEDTTSPYYELFRRTGEVSEKDLFEAQGKEGGREDRFMLARVIVAGLATNEQYALFAEPFNKGETMRDYYREAHYGIYRGRWWREGLYEKLFDHQVRANDIGNQIARGLEWASKVLFRHTDVRTLQNARTALDNGSLIKSADLTQVEVRMQGFDQLIADWNRLMQDADKIANSFEVVQGGQTPSGMPFQLGQLLDTNASKYFVHVRQKLTIAYKGAFRDFMLKQILPKIKHKDIVRLTGSVDMIDRFHEMVSNSWYLDNLARIGPHTPEMAEELKKAKIAEMKQADPVIKNTREIWNGIFPRLGITITGENYSLDEEQTIATMLQFEQDPQRRAFLLDTIYASRGIPVPSPIQPAPQEQQAQSGEMELEPNVEETV